MKAKQSSASLFAWMDPSLPFASGITRPALAPQLHRRYHDQQPLPSRPPPDSAGVCFRLQSTIERLFPEKLAERRAEAAEALARLKQQRERDAENAAAAARAAAARAAEPSHGLGGLWDRIYGGGGGGNRQSNVSDALRDLQQRMYAVAQGLQARTAAYDAQFVCSSSVVAMVIGGDDRLELHAATSNELINSATLFRTVSLCMARHPAAAAFCCHAIQVCLYYA